MNDNNNSTKNDVMITIAISITGTVIKLIITIIKILIGVLVIIGLMILVIKD